MKQDDKGIAATKPRILLDTNTLVSAFIFSGDIPRQAIKLALNHYQVVCSNNTWEELASVFQRDKFNVAMPLEQRLRVLAEFARYIEIVPVTSNITECRDPKDNQFLSLALDSGAVIIVTGDHDLLALHPWRSVEIMRAGEFVNRYI